MHFYTRRFSTIILLGLFSSLVFAFNPPPGGDSANAFFSADLLGGNASASGGPMEASLPGELTVNPALSAGEQRIGLDLSYAAIVGEDIDLGHIVNFGAIYPTRWGVLGGSFHLISSKDAPPVDTAALFHASFSKDLTDKLYVGIGLLTGTGSGWGASAELGALYHIGDLGFMSDARVGFSLTGLGRAFTPDTVGIDGEDPTGFPSPFTPHIGLGATLVKMNGFKLGASVDLSSPTFQNLALDAGLEASIRDIISIRTGWNYNLKESDKDLQTYIPSIGIGINLKLKSPSDDSFLARNGWAQSEITPSVAVKPLFEDIYAIGGGVNIKLGVKDKEPPIIAMEYPEPVYISPNSDGVKDELLFPTELTDERYITGWSFLVKDESGAVVRTIANKEKRAEMQDIKSVWSQLTKPKQSIALPDSVRWDGYTDSGDMAKDGVYTFQLVAIDDNGNQSESAPLTVHLDNSAPVVAATAPAGANAMIFSPDGDGNKDTFKIAQNGTKEDLWKLEISDSSGAVVRTIENKETAPADFAWDGKTDGGSIAPDGVYSYKVSSIDRAGNAVSARVDNIIVDTVKPAINISIDSSAFSPNSDGVQDSVLLSPSIPVTAGLVGWEVAVSARDDGVVRSFAGTGSPAAISFDGRDGTGKALKEGEYQAVISATYVNGHAPVARSPYFILDVTAPEARVRASGPIFSPVGDGKLDTVAFTQQGSSETSWTGQVFALDASGKPAGKAIKTFNFGAVPDASITWDGRDDAGKLAPDGNYGYLLAATDRAGNSGASPVAMVELNTEKADLILQANLTAFSPNGDGVKDAIVFTPIIKAATAVSRYSLVIKNREGSAVRSFEGAGKVPASFSWNGVADPAEGASTGTRVSDGLYSAALEVTLVNQQTSRSAAPDFQIDTKYPSVEISAPWIVFSPNGDGNRDLLPVTQKSTHEDLWTANLVSAKGAVVKSWRWNGQAGNFEWDATDDSGNRVADGGYTYTVTSEDKAGNRTKAQLAGVSVDARVPKAFITAELPAFSPNGDGLVETQRLALVAGIPEGLDSWHVAIRPEGSTAGTGAAVKVWNSDTAKVLPAAINWDGTDSAGKTVQGRFVAELSLSWVKGDKVTAVTPAFLVNTAAPNLGVKLSPKYFSPDNDGIDDELTVNLKAESAAPLAEWSFEIREPEGTSGGIFWSTRGTDKITERLIWDGRSLKGEPVQAATDYPFTFTVKDSVGLTSVVRGYIPVDVLIIRDGDRLKIAVPSIIFRENAADFDGLDPQVVEKNTQVLKRIAEILNKFKDYRVQVEGHANNVTGTQKEEDTELIPLSSERAEAVRAFLIRNGVGGDRLSTIGMGGTKPVTKRADRDNWWKNRRVEFILLK